MSKNLALVFPRSTFLNDPKTWMPLGLFYLGAQLEAQGHHCDFFDLSFNELPEDGAYDQLWVSATSPQMLEIKRIAEITKDWKTKTVLGGAAPWANPDACRGLGFDLVVAGESDHPDSVSQVIDLLSVSTRKNGELITFPISSNLEWVLPPIRRWSTQYYSYMTDRWGNKHRMTSMFTSRGCPMECAFCESGRHGVIWDRLTRYEPLWCVEQQIKESKELGFTGLAYYDDILPLSKKRMFEIIELHQKYEMVYRCFLRSDIICKQGGKEYLQQMQEGGLIEVFVGVESADNQIKKNITKGTTIEQDASVLEWCTELGITCKMSFILGLPGESYESMEATRQWILKHRPQRVQVDRLIPFTGTPLTSHPENYDLEYEQQPDEEWFYRGRMDIGSKSFVRTSHLSVDEIDAFWHKLEIELEQEGLKK